MMGSVCADNQHKFQNSYPFYLKKSLTELDIAPRKILNRLDPDMYLDSPTKLEGSIFQKFLPYNNLDDDPYSADHFRMYEFKVRRCTRSRSHDWTDCPFAHPGEKARRRDPRKFHYSGTVCSEFRKGRCSLGDNCEFAHGVFESWLHPARYRTEACKDGKNCKRKVCFFAHSPRQLRILPVNRYESDSLSPVHRYLSRGNLCCRSPTSTLMDISISHMSPPQSPGKTPFCRCSGVVAPYGMTAAQLEAIGMMSYKDALTELVNSLEAMNVKQVNNPLSNRNMNLSMNIPLVDMNLGNGVDQTPLSLSPSTPGHIYGSKFVSPQRNNTFFDGGDGGLTGIDLGWVNDLLT